MAAAERYEYHIYTGYPGPRNATHFRVHQSVEIMEESEFCDHPNIVELICHAGIDTFEMQALCGCPRLRRVIIPGVKVVEEHAFFVCEALTYVECPKLERVGDEAFYNCKSLSNINLSSVKVIEDLAFGRCQAMTDVKFGKNLESIGKGAFRDCTSLERITIPLKNGIITADDIFTGCDNLRRVDPVEGEVLYDTITTLLLEEWRNDMFEEIDSINQILPKTYDGYTVYDEGGYLIEIDPGEKTLVMRGWITRVLRKIIHYKAEHRRLLNAAKGTLQLAFPSDIVMNHIFPFLKLPEHIFDGEV